MVEKKDNPSKMELLKIAKDLVYSEYVTKKNDIHEKWVVESLYLWQTQQVRLAYPELPSYPTDTDIVNRAKTLSYIIEEDTMSVNNITINNTQTNKEAVKPATEKKESLFDRLLKLLSVFGKKQ
jgi:hypothetical protein